MDSKDDIAWSSALNSGKEQFGNLDVNLRFLQQSGCIKASKKVLEVGCGIGTIVHWLLQQGCQAVGTDISSVAVEYGKRKYPHISLKVESAEQLSYPDEEFDLVMSFDVFEHLSKVDMHLAEVYRVLKPGGYYLLQTPNKFSNALFETVRNRSLSWQYYHPSLHSPRQLRKRLIKNGLRVQFVKMNPVTPFFLKKLPQVPPLLWLIRHIPFTHLPLWMQTNLYVISQKQLHVKAPESEKSQA
jgi:ubiquinone/menaquinone biosynthesis C-methylase UbiE